MDSYLGVWPQCLVSKQGNDLFISLDKIKLLKSPNRDTLKCYLQQESYLMFVMFYRIQQSCFTSVLRLFLQWERTKLQLIWSNFINDICNVFCKYIYKYLQRSNKKFNWTDSSGSYCRWLSATTRPDFRSIKLSSTHFTCWHTLCWLFVVAPSSWINSKS